MKRPKVLLIVALALTLCGLGYWLWSKHRATGNPEFETTSLTIYIQGKVEDADALRAMLDGLKDKVVQSEIRVVQDSDLDPINTKVAFDLALMDIDSVKRIESSLGAFPSDTPWVKSEAREEFYEINGEVIALPFYEQDYLVLYADKTKIKAPPTTWFDLAMLGLSFTDRAHHQYGLALGEEVSYALPFFPELLKNPAELNPRALEAGFKRLALLRNQFPIVPLDCRGLCAENLFVKRQAPMALAGDDNARKFAAAIGLENFTVIALPQGEALPIVSDRRTQYLVRSKNLSKRQSEQLSTLLAYWQSEDGQNHIYNAFFKVPSRAVTEKMTLTSPIAQDLASYIRSSTKARSREQHDAAVKLLEPGVRPYLAGVFGVIGATEELMQSNPVSPRK